MGEPAVERRTRQRPADEPGAAVPAEAAGATGIGHLQLAGNDAVASLLQAAQLRTTVGASDDPLEHEADAVARGIVARALGGSAPAPTPTRGSAGAGVRRRAEVGHEGGDLNADAEQAIGRARSGGVALDPTLQSNIGAHLDADLSAVRLHAGPEATQLNEQMHATAFTLGTDVFFRDGLPDISTPGGLELLGHELTHTVQQSVGSAGGGVQRNTESAELMEELIVPKAFDGPEVELQKELVAKLEEVLADHDRQREANAPPDEDVPPDPYALSCLGGIVLDKPDSDSLQDLIKNAILVELPKNDVRGPMDRSVNVTSFDVAKAAKAEGLIIANTLATMEKAKQLDYLRKSGLLQSDKWKILIEIHYYRSRDKTSQQFHKDSLGQTLFVNLNFVNDTEIPGPEYVLNPNRVGDTRNLDQTLPEVFNEDLGGALAKQPEPDRIEATRIPPNGMVAFVDEALHHKSPTVGHRELSPQKLRNGIEEKLPGKLKAAEEAYTAYEKQTYVFRKTKYSKFLDENDRTAAAWEQVVLALRKKGRYDRTKLAELFPPDGPIEIDVDRLLEAQGGGIFNDSAIPGVTKRIPVKGNKDAPPLKRTMSDWALSDKVPEVPSGPRRFFRTWIRAVPRT